MCNVVVLELSQAVVDAGAVPLLVLCIQEPELSLKRIAASGLSDICKHSPEVNINLSYLPITRLYRVYKKKGNRTSARYCI
jgi:hypothetical protein